MLEITLAWCPTDPADHNGESNCMHPVQQSIVTQTLRMINDSARSSASVCAFVWQIWLSLIWCLLSFTHRFDSPAKHVNQFRLGHRPFDQSANRRDDDEHGQIHTACFFASIKISAPKSTHVRTGGGHDRRKSIFHNLPHMALNALGLPILALAHTAKISHNNK